MSLQASFLIALWIWFPRFIAADFCPKVCIPCTEHFISCTSGGLNEIPKDLHIDTTKITLIGHQFSQSILSRQNFSRFSKPKYSIEQLSIRRSNIQIIQSQAFFDLSGLDTLDLSENDRLFIDERAFANLKLKLLHLDSIGNLSLSMASFDGLLVASLSIKNSSLEQLPYNLLDPLSKDLRKLFLSKNRIRSLSSKFEALFRQLTVLDLHDNPLLCSCGLLWLGTTLRWRQLHFTGMSGPFSVVQLPTCAGPSYLRDQFIDQVPDSEFDCHPPKLDRIEIQFQKVNSAILRCSATIIAKRAPLNIFWTYEGYFYPRLSQTLTQHEAAILVSRRNSLDRFVCSIVTESGNTSVKINIHWPEIRPIKTSTNITLYKHPKLSNVSQKPTANNQNFFFKEQYSLLELLGSVIGTFVVTMLIFIVIYRCYFFKAIKLKKEQLKKSGYATYEAALYSDSQTYDIPQYPSFDQRRRIFQPVFLMPPHSNQPLMDYTNNRKL